MVKIFVYEIIIDFFLNNSNIYFIFDKCFCYMMIILKDIYIWDKLLMYFMIYY